MSAHGSLIGHEPRSILTNLATNSFKATPDGGRVDIHAQDYGDRVIVEVKDNGKGIPAHLLSRVIERGFSFEKASGTGLGLHYAQENINAWRGELRISSEKGRGTSIRVSIPIQSREPWYVPRIKLGSTDTVTVVDDQLSVHDVWKERLLESGFHGSSNFFTTVDDALVFLKNSSSGESKQIIFADYDLGRGETGIDLLSKLDFDCDRYLVTGHFDLEEVQTTCKQKNLFLIPKTALSEIPITARPG